MDGRQQMVKGIIEDDRRRRDSWGGVVEGRIEETMEGEMEGKRREKM